MSLGIAVELLQRIHRTNPAVEHLLELVGQTDEDVRSTPDEWATADSLTAFRITEEGYITLAGTADPVLDHDTGADEQSDMDLDLPHDVARVEWATINQPIHRVRAYLNPDPAATGQDVATWVCVLYRLVEVTEGVFTEAPGAGLVIQEIGRAEESAGASEGYVEFDFFTGGVPPNAGGIPLNGALGGFNRPVTYVRIVALDADRNAASNVAWDGDDAIGSFTDNGHILRGRRLVAADTPGYVQDTAPDIPVPRIQIEGDSFTESVLAFTVTPFDFAAAPAGSVELVLIFSNPAGSAITATLDDGAGQVTFVDGDIAGQDNTPDGGEDLAAVTAPPYDVRITFTPSPTSSVAPVLRAVGIRDLKRNIVRGLVSLTGGRINVDVPDLICNIPKVEATVLHDGIPDLWDPISRYVSETHRANMSVRLYLGHRTLPRNKWLLRQVFSVQDWRAGQTAITLDLVGVNARVRGVLPVPTYDPTWSETAFTQTNQAIADVWAAILSAISLPARYIGNPPSDTTQITQAVERSDALTELNAISGLAGGVNVPAQGRVSFVQIQRDTYAIQPTLVFPDSEIRMTNVTPGLDFAVPRYIVEYQWNATNNEFDSGVIVFNDDAAEKIGLGFQTTVDLRLPAAMAKWIVTEAHALIVALRFAKARATGLRIWSFDSIYMHPQAQVGDVCAVQTRQFFMADPVSSRILKGRLWALAVIVAIELDAQGFDVWVPDLEQVATTYVSGPPEGAPE